MKWVTTLATAALCLASAKTECPSGWVNLGDSDLAPVCMYFVRETTEWTAMRAYCEAIGGNLAKLTGDLHQLVVKYITTPNNGLDDKTFWIGGTDEDDEGSWKWITDGTPIPLGPPHWYLCSDQPSGGNRKNYLCLDQPDFYFHSCTGDNLYNGICQI